MLGPMQLSRETGLITKLAPPIGQSVRVLHRRTMPIAANSRIRLVRLRDEMQREVPSSECDALAAHLRMRPEAN